MYQRAPLMALVLLTKLQLLWSLVMSGVLSWSDLLWSNKIQQDLYAFLTLFHIYRTCMHE